MSEMFLCLDCGRIGDKDNLVFYEVNIPDNEIINKIVLSNHLGSFKCSACSSANVLYGRPEVKMPYVPPTIIPSATSPYGPHTDLQTTTNYPTTINTTDTTQSPEQEEKPRPIIRFKNECDSCKKEFSSKVSGATRCSDCIKKMIK
jgi:hypothetical protein